MKKFVFGYGSLMNAESASRAIGKKLKISDFIPCFLHGYKRGWYIKESVTFDDKNVLDVLFLDIKKEHSSKINGVLIEVNENELSRIQAREKNYYFEDVTNLVEPKIVDAEVLVAVSKSEFQVNEDEPGLIGKRYIDMVETAAKQINLSFFDDYLKTTASTSKHQIIIGEYKFIDNEQAKYV